MMLVLIRECPLCHCRVELSKSARNWQINFLHLVCNWNSQSWKSHRYTRDIALWLNHFMICFTPLHEMYLKVLCMIDMHYCSDSMCKNLCKDFKIFLLEWRNSAERVNKFWYMYIHLLFLLLFYLKSVDMYAHMYLVL